MASSRRSFVKQCSLCALAAAIGGGSMLISSCASLPIVKSTVANGKILIDKTLLTDPAHHIVRVSHLDYDLLLSKRPQGGYRCVYLQCSHQDYPVKFNGSKLVCNQHGSSFDLEGKVLTGPASNSLRQFPVYETEMQVEIKIL